MSTASVRLFERFPSAVFLCALLRVWAVGDEPQLTGIRIGSFEQEIHSVYTTEHGLPDVDIRTVLAGSGGEVYAATASGLAKFDNGKWLAIGKFEGDVKLLASNGTQLYVMTGASLFRRNQQSFTQLARCPHVDEPNALRSLVVGRRTLLGTTAGLFELKQGNFVRDSHLNRLLGETKEVRQITMDKDGRVAVAAESGLFLYRPGGRWTSAQPRTKNRSWSPSDVRGVAFDELGRLWFASPQGVGCLDDGRWSLYTGEDGLPYNDFTTISSGKGNIIWFGTKLGAIRFDGKRWFYRQGLRWLPHDDVRSIAVSTQGHTWFATSKGVGQIKRRGVTLAEKAAIFEQAIDKHHRRTPYGFVNTVRLSEPGDASEWTQLDSDNDGLWTGMYGAGECFAYAATGNPAAKRRATAAFEALRFLSQVNQGGMNSALPGFPARSILPVSGRNPNLPNDRERDQAKQVQDPLWKIISPRWPMSEDGKWYWKCDTSSDELDGHYFLYAQYFDLVAKTPAEKARVRDVVLSITDHLIDHNFELIDHDGKPTRWARYSPEALNGGLMWVERGLNSLSMLSYLKVAEHMSGGKAVYRQAYHRLIKEHGYAINVLNPKLQNGQGSGNQSDDEMAFMCFYNLLKYERDPELRKWYNIALRRYWALEEPELCPLFNYIFAASYDGVTSWNAENVGVPAARVPRSCLEDAAETLKRFPLDRIRWGYKNSHRIDLIPLRAHILESQGRGHRRDGRVLPIDERFVEQWNHSPWRLDEGGDGRTLADGAAFLLPYYMGLHHRFIIEQSPPAKKRSRQ